MGETVGLQLMLKKNAQASVDWGDRKSQVLTGRQKLGSEELAWLEARHEYSKKGSYYTITIESSYDRTGTVLLQEQRYELVSAQTQLT